MSSDSNSVNPLTPPKAGAAERLWSIDAFRGLAMLLMASHGLSLGDAARYFPQSPAWQAIAFHTEHVEWRGWALWDLIQPSFMFLVGTSMAFSYAKRQKQGETYWNSFGHALIRAVVLALLGIFLRSMGRSQSNFTFEDVLTQIGLGYIFLFLLWNRGFFVQFLAAAAILVGWYIAVELHPLPPPGFDYATVGVSQEWLSAHGLPSHLAHWNKNTNLAADFDVWFLNLFPRKEYFRFNGGGYQTLNFIPALATMVFGLMAGTVLKGRATRADKLVSLLLMGLLLTALGMWLDASQICPLVKRIWTPTWAVWSAGIASLCLAVFYLLVDIAGLQMPAWPLVVVGANSIVVYVLSWIGYSFFRANLQTHVGLQWTRDLGILFSGGSPHGPDALGPVVENAAILFIFWLICVWLWKQKVFIKI